MGKTIVQQDFETFMAMVRNSVGADVWRNGYVLIDGEKTDIMRGGELSCAFYVTTMLKMFGVIGDIHANMDSTVKDLEKTGWNKVEEPEVGDVVVWGPKPTGDVHNHAGFYIGDEKVVTNNYERAKAEAGGRPAVVDWLYRGHPDGQRPLVAIYRGRHLFES